MKGLAAPRHVQNCPCLHTRQQRSILGDHQTTYNLLSNFCASFLLISTQICVTKNYCIITGFVNCQLIEYLTKKNVDMFVTAICGSYGQHYKIYCLLGCNPLVVSYIVPLMVAKLSKKTPIHCSARYKPSKGNILRQINPNQSVSETPFNIKSILQPTPTYSMHFQVPKADASYTDGSSMSLFSLHHAKSREHHN